MARPEKKTEVVDVYLYYLLKRMIEFEVTKTLSYEPRRTEIVKHIEAHSPFSKAERITVAEYFRKHLWKPKAKKIGERELDWMVKIVRTLGDFSSWRQFEAMFKSPDPPDSKIIISQSHSEIDSRTRTQIMMTILYYHAWQRGRLPFTPKQHILFSQLEYHDVILLPLVFRMTIEELHVIHLLHKDLVPDYQRKHETLVEWYNKNWFLYYACKDKSHDYISILIVLPIKEHFIDLLKSGNKTKEDIGSDDIYSHKERGFVNYVLIESFLSFQVSAIRNYKVLFNDIIGLIADKQNQNLIVGAIGCSEQAERILRRYGFVETIYRVRIDKSSDEYSLFEVTWTKLDFILGVYNSVFLNLDSITADSVI